MLKNFFKKIFSPWYIENKFRLEATILPLILLLIAGTQVFWEALKFFIFSKSIKLKFILIEKRYNSILLIQTKLFYFRLKNRLKKPLLDYWHILFHIVNKASPYYFLTNLKQLSVLLFINKILERLSTNKKAIITKVINVNTT